MKGIDAKIKLKQSGIKLKDIADTLNYSQQKLYSLFESDSMKVETLEKIAIASGKPIQFFLDVEPLKKATDPEKEDNVDYYIENIKKDGKIEMLQQTIREMRAEMDDLKIKLNNQSLDLRGNPATAG